MARSRHSDLRLGDWEPVPFRQVMVLVAAMVLAVVLVPVGVQAAGQLVSIVDGDSDTDQVQVDSGKLRVGDGSGSLTVDGGVVATPGIPFGQRLVAIGVPAGGKNIIAGPFSSTTRFAISTLTFYGAGVPTRAALEVRSTINGLCHTSGTVRGGRAVANVYPNQTIHLAYPETLVAPFGVSTAGVGWCLYATGSSGSYIVSVVGRAA